jgi:GGDEF domain-containing protein
MKLFRRHEKTPNVDEVRSASPEDLLFDPETELYVPWYLHMRLAEEVQRAVRHGRPLTIIVCVPQELPGQKGTQAVETISPQFSQLLRGGDLVGRIEEGVIAVGLPETPESGARVLAQRLRSELVLRAAHVSKRNWLVGWAVCPEDGENVEALLEFALTAAQQSRRAAA